MTAKPLSEMKDEESVIVNEFKGGRNFTGRLNSLGIKPGTRITVVSSMRMKGPVTVQIGSATIAIGAGMAQKIMVKV
ncbi:MAG: FeoA family protein [Deltaproteobacteria bacterium]|nr:FeoA family protein [Deltaproteobacteria bacterium]